ncbi:MAG TPA: hypothetical protein VN324_06350, partial [Quisquiliibacterium sp.]|nr:hypothetical protein [Quisquiliibacterium sp.]
QAIDRSRAELAEASADVGSEAASARALAESIDPSASPEDALARIPAPTARAELEERLRAAERAGQALEQHRESARQQSAQAAVEALPPLPSPETRAALRIAQSELARRDATLRRLAELPGAIRAARRTLDAGLEALGLKDEAALRAPRPLLDALIDEAIERQRSNATLREEREARIAQISAALQGEQAEHRRLLERGAVPTADDVREARGRRDAVWRSLRDTAFGRGGPAPDDTGELASMADAYEAATAHADRLADALALDSERAARLQSCLRNIAALEHDRQTLRQELERILGEEALRLEGWQRTLAAARLPELSPPALRDWQALLAQARAAQETLQGLQDELGQADAVGASLAYSLRAAILGTGLASPPAGATLDLLSACASEVEAEIRQREQAHGSAAGQRIQFERQQAQMQARGEELAEALRVTGQALAPLLGRLGLPADAGLEVVRARLGEFDALAAAQARLSTASSKQLRASTLLASLEDDARAIAARLGDPDAGDVRAFVDRATARLEAAERMRNARALALQALESAQESRRMHQEAADGHRERLDRLCLAAGVASESELPEAEERSRRRRELQATIDRAGGQLAEASRRPIAELRALLADRDTARMDAEEAGLAQEQSRLDEALRAARAGEESARHALHAIDGTDAAAAEREAMERSAAGVRAAMSPWIRSRLAHALLSEALARFRDRAQAPMLRSASGYFERMTGGEFVRLAGDDSDERPVLVAERRDGSRLRVEGMSEGTRDQLYLALRLAALELRRAAGVDLPVLLDDVLMTSDDRRASLMLGALADLARGGQVVVFTHHRHLAELARACLPAEALTVVELERS